MDIISDPLVFEDPKIKTSLKMLEEGKSRDEIAQHFGYKDMYGIDQYFRRRGFKWSGTSYILSDEVKSPAEDARLVNTKAAQIVRLLSQKHANIKQIAVKSGFETVKDMGDYMKSQGYDWDNDQNNYRYDEAKRQRDQKPVELPGVDGGMERYMSLLGYLLSKQEKLVALLETEGDGTLPRYKFRGGKANKTLGMPVSLQTLLEDFSKEFNVTQRDIIEVALAEFFKKYGYEEQLNSAIHL